MKNLRAKNASVDRTIKETKADDSRYRLAYDNAFNGRKYK